MSTVPTLEGITSRIVPTGHLRTHVLQRGDSDLIVADSSFFDFGMLGRLGYVPGWPGEEVYPPQPMVSQMRAVLERYRANGGRYQEVVIADAGHSPHVEQRPNSVAPCSPFCRRCNFAVTGPC